MSKRRVSLAEFQLENLDPERRPTDEELRYESALVAFRDADDGIILFSRGTDYGMDILSESPHILDNVIGECGQRPDEGVWVWVGYFYEYHVHTPDMNEWELDCVTHCWRRLNWLEAFHLWRGTLYLSKPPKKPKKTTHRSR